MKFDFTTRVNRQGQGSMKWEDMYNKKSDVSEGVVPLSVADMEFHHPDKLIDGLCDHLRTSILGYTTATDSFKESVVNWMKKRHNFEIEKDWIVNTSGIVPAFFNAIREFTNEGDGIIIMSPVYYPFYNAINFQNRKLVDCPLVEKDGYYTIDYDLFDKLSKENKVLLFCSPHNPVGRVWKEEELKKLAEIIKKNNVFLLSDEIHFDLIMPGYKHTVFQTIDEEIADNMITFTAPSKSFNIAGMGLSNIIIKNDKIREKFVQGLGNTASYPFTAMGFKACEIVYNECEDWLDECVEVINTNQKLVNEFFEKKHPEIKAPLIEGTYLQWMDFRSLGLDYKELEDFMINKAELFLDEGYIFGENGKGYERINLAAPTEVIKEALERLDKALNELK
ncbi:MAG: MalY/PatB family protein [Peptoniphilus duerdenii]|uniref:MalY/PatB family protein n=1 Tax=Peptoniphilus duerdenii TaxID=507750 RepID=UPI00254C9D91|nr:MalY/PatB family protein [Peptoniphilus duerdenii]MDK8276115.1 MalY/PatB family protein [Peptoniphilus duerdenii]